MGKRLNRIISLMENHKPAFGTFVSNGNLDEITESVDLGFDFVIIENEHAGMDFQDLRISLQFLIDRRRIQAGTINEFYPTPLVRVSPNADEIHSNQWIIKQTLDLGAFGLLIPKLETVESAQYAVDLCRYPTEPIDEDMPFAGKRGWGPKRASRYWGMTINEYVRSADLWPLNPDGELLLIGICETALGLKNLPDILTQVKGIGAILVGPGDLAASLGLAGQIGHPTVESSVIKFGQICKDYGVPAAINASSPEEVQVRLSQVFRILQNFQAGSNSALTEGLASRIS